MKRNCSNYCLNKKENGNCLIPGEDNLPMQCVGPWVEEKFYYLEKYLNATCKVRKKFVENGNTVFIDLFSGPGKCIIRNDKKEIDSGGMRSLLRDEAPFNTLYFFDIDIENIRSLKARLQNYPQCITQEGDSNELVIDLIKILMKNPQKYHFIFIDPFGPSGLKFKTIECLSQLERLDMLINFPIGALKRIYKQQLDKNNSEIIDDFLGVKKWRNDISKISTNKIGNLFLNIFTEQLKKIGFKEEGLRLITNDNISQTIPSVIVKNKKDVDLYMLILISKHRIAPKIWDSVIKIDYTGQKQLF